MKTTAILLLFLVLIFGSCNNLQRPEAEPAPAETSEPVAQAGNSWKNDMRLDKGARWQANEETTEGIVQMQALIERTSPKSREEYRQLAEGLTAHLNTIIGKCTMKGEPHDHLHIYLKPLVIQIARLNQTASIDEGEKLSAEIREHLQAYKVYFR